MNNNIRIARQLVKIAKNLVASNLLPSSKIRQNLLPVLNDMKTGIKERGGIIGLEEPRKDGWDLHFTIDGVSYKAVIVDVAFGHGLRWQIAFFGEGDVVPISLEIFTNNVNGALDFIFGLNK